MTKFTKQIKRRPIKMAPPKPPKTPDEPDEPEDEDLPDEENPAPAEEEQPPAGAIEEIEPGIFYTAHKGIYHAEIKNGGSVINAGNHPTLEAAQSALARAKADVNL